MLHRPIEVTVVFRRSSKISEGPLSGETVAGIWARTGSHYWTFTGEAFNLAWRILAEGESAHPFEIQETGPNANLRLSG